MTAVEDALTAELDAEPVTPKRRATKAGTLAEALAAMQAEMPSVTPGGRNPAFKNSKYVKLDDLIDATRPVANRHGLSVSQWPTFLNVGDGTTMIPALRTVVTHVSGEQMEATMPLILSKNDMQGLGSALTYARRYMWASALGISADEDDDGNQASQKPAGASRAPSAGKPDPGVVLASADDLAAYRVDLADAGFDADEILATHAKRNERLTPEFVTLQRERLAAFVAEQAALAEGPA